MASILPIQPYSTPLTLNAGTNAGLFGPPFDVTDDAGAIIASDSDWPSDPEKVPLPFLDTGAFVAQLDHLQLLPSNLEFTDEQQAALQNNPDTLVHIVQDQRDKDIQDGNPPRQIYAATYRTTQLNLTKSYDTFEQTVIGYMDAANFEPVIPTSLPLEKRRNSHKFTIPNENDKNADHYPPHLNLSLHPVSPGKAGGVQDPTLSQFAIFNTTRLAQIMSLLPAVVPINFLQDSWKDIGKKIVTDVVGVGSAVVVGAVGTPADGKKISDVEQYNIKRRSEDAHWYHHKDIFDRPNIGDLSDWFTDARFAQQHFTGTNPTTITQAEHVIRRWIDHFVQAATEQGLNDVKTKLLDRAASKSLYVQDYSYFREAAGLGPDAEMSYKAQKPQPVARYSVASVCIFNLQDNGKLHPLGIVIDWRGSAKQSVTIFNKKLDQPTYEQLKKGDKPVKSATETAADQVEREDWAWRYAKTCVQTSDWLRHEVTVHLTNTHLIEEATIVAANRSFETNHAVYRLLYPHWQKTLSLNAAARLTLVPSVIVPIVGMPDSAVYKFIRSAYAEYDFEGSYAPKDLEKRGFPVAELNSPKFHNYVWARCIHSMWYKIREYVSDTLEMWYGICYDDNARAERDQKVKSDTQIKTWVDEMKNGAQVTTFPNISTFNDLIDCVTMCIHIASPQHTSVNYLQNFYQAFVINKPPCLYTPPPATLKQLQAFTEDDLVKALPINHPHEWLLASHIPYLLSFKPGDKESLIVYANSKFHLAQNSFSSMPDPISRRMRIITGKFYGNLVSSAAEFKGYADEADDSPYITYDVLNPSWNAVSILI